VEPPYPPVFDKNSPARIGLKDTNILIKIFYICPPPPSFRSLGGPVGPAPPPFDLHLILILSYKII